MKNFTGLERVLIFLGIFIFIFLASVVIFKPEWLHTVFYRNPIYYYISSDDEQVDEFSVAENPKVSLNLISDKSEEKVSIFLEFDSSVDVSGVEVFFDKEESLEVVSLDCEESFECIFTDFSKNEMVLSAIIPIGESGALFGNVLLAEFEYTGSGSIYFDSSANFVADVKNPELNILDLTAKEFYIE